MLSVEMSPTDKEALEEVLAAIDDREKHWRRWISDAAAVTALAEGRWDAVFPKDFGPDDVPMIANLPRVAIEDGGRLFAEARPTERCDAPADSEKKRNEKKEQALAAGTSLSEFYDHAELYGQDMIATGLTAIKVWPDLGVPISRRFPIFSRVDPRFLLPEPRFSPDRPTDNVLTHYTRPLSDVAREFPAETEEMLGEIRRVGGDRIPLIGQTQGTPTEVRLADWWSSRHISRVLIIKHQGRRYARLVTSFENPTGLCPVQLAARYTWSMQPQGQIADSRGMLRTQNRYFSMLLRQFTQMVYGPVLTWNVADPNKTSGVIQALGPDARYDRVGVSNVSFQALQILEMLDGGARTSMVAPRSREGEVDLNKATAAFLSTAQGQLSSVTRSLQTSFAHAKRRANEAWFALDEHFCNAEKEVTGRARGQRFRMTYRPREVIQGDYSNRVFYGTTSGLDRPTHQILQLQKKDQGLISDETFMENDPDIEDVAAEKARVFRQDLEQAVRAKLGTDPRITVQQLLRAWKESGGGDTALEKIADALLAEPEVVETPEGPVVREGAAEPPTGGPPGVAGAQGTPALMPFNELERVATRRR